MALLRLLPVSMQYQCVNLAFHLKVDLETIGLRQTTPDTLRFFTHDIIIHRKPSI